MIQYFNGDATVSELGTHRFVKGWIQAFPGADAPWPGDLVKRVHEFDPAFRLMWVVNVWRTPTDGIRKTGQYMIARQVVNPKNTNKWIKHPLLPSTSVAGVTYRPPFLDADILDGRTDAELQGGSLPKFKPFTGQHVETMRAAMWIRDNVHPDVQQKAIDDAAAEAEARFTRSLHKEFSYRKQHDRTASNRATGVGTVDRVYVSDTLTQLRKAAGVTEAA